MHVLVTNDDGIESPGLAVLVAAARARGHDVVVAAPSHEHSGASASLLGAEQDGRLVVDDRSAPGVPDDVPSFAVGAAPALIAYYAVAGAFGRRPDLVLSGVNRRQNTGHMLLHSGTAGAALTGALHDVPGIAVSIASSDPQHWDTAGAVLGPVLAWAEEHARPDRVLNLNVPDLPTARVRGLRRAPLARLGAVQARVDREGGFLRMSSSDVETFTGGPARPDAELDPDARDADGALPTDAVLLAHGWATLTQIHSPADDPDAALPSWDGAVHEVSGVR